MYRKTLSTLIGLVGAENNNGKTDDTDAIVRQALLHMHEEYWSGRIREEKFRIDEEKCNGCGICANACHEGAIEIIDGKAKLARERFCDGSATTAGPDFSQI